MNKYPKIQTIFKRDPDTNYSTLLEGEYSKPEFEFLADVDWVFREKIHGTNLRLIYRPDQAVPVALYGRTENSQVPSFLTDEILNREGLVPRLREQFGDTPACLYGEGYGAKIQKEGKYYLPDSHDFCLFDVKIGDWWLQEQDITDIASSLDFERAPISGIGLLSKAVELVRKGFASRIAKKNIIAEGLILHPEVELFDRSGDRIMTKIKHEDFEGNSMVSV